AVARIAARAARALTAAGVDLADDALAARDGAAARIVDDADEFVADRAAKARVATHELEVGVADTRQRHAYERLAVRSWKRLLDELHRSICHPQRSHAATLAPTVESRRMTHTPRPHPAAQKHGELRELLPGLWFVTGTVKMPGPLPVRFSRNMTVVKQG